MAWLATNDDERNAIAQLDNDSDRAAGIVAAAIVENRLEQAIKSRLHPHDDIHRELLHPSGPLGSFAMKINLGFVMGVISSGTLADLKTIKNIRNRFAHHLDIRASNHRRFAINV